MAGSKKCTRCSKPLQGKQIKWCSTKCKNEYRRAQLLTASERTAYSYRSVSNRWPAYFKKMLRLAERKAITPDDLMELLSKQQYRCALSGVPLTCKLERGELFLTNASLDRIDPKGGYVIENVQLVCSALNQWRGQISVEEFAAWCTSVAENFWKE